MQNPLLNIATELPNFDDIEPNHAIPALKDIISSQNIKLNDILNNHNIDNFESIIEPLEQFNYDLHRIWSPISHLQNVLDDKEWREAYNTALPEITQHNTSLLQNRKLKDAYKKIFSSIKKDEEPEKYNLLEQGLRNFHLAGVNLNKELKTKYQQKKQKLVSAEAAFSQFLQDSTDSWNYHTENKKYLLGIPKKILEQAKKEAKKNNLEGWMFQLNFPTYHAIMHHGENREIRKIFYRAFCTRASDQADNKSWDNQSNIEKILALRHQCSQLIGFNNYAEFSLASKMAKDANEVKQFLLNLAKKATPAAQKELEEIKAASEDKIEPWDISYLLEKIKKNKYSVGDELLRPYFPFNQVSKGLFSFIENLYGLIIIERNDISKWHPSVQYFEVQNENKKIIGGFYIDPFARKGKRGGAWMDELGIRKEFNQEIRNPIGLLICNFTPPDSKGLSLLNHDEVVTLFHEFGHMLHHLLTKVNYPSISGINGVPWDGVELPSQFMENFAWCYDVLKNISGHYQTNTPLPKSLFKKLIHSRNFGEGLATLRQIEFALFDIEIHASYDPSKGSLALDTLEKVRKQVSIIDYPEFNRFPNSFSHIFAGGYAAGYYSYKWAEVMAADAFSAFEEKGIFNQNLADKFRQEILEKGGSKDFMECYKSFRGREPNIDALLKQSGMLDNL